MADEALANAKAWMLKAWRDLETARRAVGGNPPFYDVGVYHCQQAAEKALKAFLVYHERAFENTHDVGWLVELAAEVDADFLSLADAADAVTPYATRFRYPNAAFTSDPHPDQYQEAKLHARTIFNFVLHRLPKSARPRLHENENM